jgi:hypothetical protein
VTRHAYDIWTIRFRVPAGRHSGRTFAAFLKALGRRWGIKAERIVEASEEPAPDVGTPQRATGAIPDPLAETNR